MRGASKVILQLHQILRLPHKMNLSSMICVTHEPSFPMRGASKVTFRTHKVLRLPRNSEFKNELEKRPEVPPPLERRFDDMRTENRHLAPAASTTSPIPSRRRSFYEKIQRSALWLSPKIARNAAPVRKSDPPTSPNSVPATQNECRLWSASHMNPSFPMRGASKITVRTRKVLRLPRNS